MGGWGITYAILAAIVWGTYLFAIKRYFSKYPPSVFVAVGNGFAFVWYLPIALLTIRSQTVPMPVVGTFEIGVVAGAIAVNAAGVIVSFRAVTTGDVSYVAPISKITPVFVLPMEVALLEEKLTELQVVGVMVATAGVYLANYRGDGFLTPLRKAVSYGPGRLALTAAALFAVVDLSRRVILQELHLPTPVWILALFGGMTLSMTPLATRRDMTIGTELKRFAALGALAALGEHLTAHAFAVLPASFASPILNTQAVIAVLLGGLILDEQELGVRLLAAIIAIVGVSIITIS